MRCRSSTERMGGSRKKELYRRSHLSYVLKDERERELAVCATSQQCEWARWDDVLEVKGKKGSFYSPLQGDHIMWLVLLESGVPVSWPGFGDCDFRSSRKKAWGSPVAMRMPVRCVWLSPKLGELDLFVLSFLLFETRNLSHGGDYNSPCKEVRNVLTM